MPLQRLDCDYMRLSNDIYVGMCRPANFLVCGQLPPRCCHITVPRWGKYHLDAVIGMQLQFDVLSTLTAAVSSLRGNHSFAQMATGLHDVVNRQVIRRSSHALDGRT